MTFGIMAWSHVANLNKDFEELKKSLINSGVLKEKLSAED